MIEQLQQAITDSGLSRYAICKATGIAQSVMSRFMAGTQGLTLDSADKLAQFLGYELTKCKQTKGR